MLFKLIKDYWLSVTNKTVTENRSLLQIPKLTSCTQIYKYETRSQVTIILKSSQFQILTL